MPTGFVEPRNPRARARDVMLRHTRVAIGAVAAGAVGLSGLFSVVAAQAFKGHATRSADPVRARAAPTPRTARVHVPAPQRIPAIASQPAPLQPPAQPPAAATPEPAPAAPAPQVSGGS
jgi:hypothetical protein